MRYIDVGPRRILIKDSGEWFNLPEFVQLSTEKGVVNQVRFTGPPYAYFYHLMEIDGHQYVSYCKRILGDNEPCVETASGRHDTKRGYMVPCYDYNTGSERVLDITIFEYQEIKPLVDQHGLPTGYDVQLSRATRRSNKRRYHRDMIEPAGRLPQDAYDFNKMSEEDRMLSTAQSEMARENHEAMLANAHFALYRVSKVDAHSMFTTSSSEWIQEQLTKLTSPHGMIASTIEATNFFDSPSWEHQLFEI
jgi:hypothetical protein